MFMFQDIVYSLFRHIPRHALFLVLTHQIAILAGQLTVLGDNKGDGFSHSLLPGARILLDCCLSIIHYDRKNMIRQFVYQSKILRPVADVSGPRIMISENGMALSVSG